MARISVERNEKGHRGLALWLLILSVFAPALFPVEAPLQSVSGSAFSAFTSDVAVAPPRYAGWDDRAADRSPDPERSTGDGPDPLHLRNSRHEDLASVANAATFLRRAAGSRSAHSPYAPRAPPTA